MAQWIKADGTSQEVHPAGTEFTNDELHNMVDGFLTGITLTGRDQGGLYMFMDDESIVKGKPFNQAATDLVRKHRANLQHVQVFGDVVVADLSETGDE
jgi:uncharacterized protein YgfB (UPF0149 family)